MEELFRVVIKTTDNKKQIFNTYPRPLHSDCNKGLAVFAICKIMEHNMMHRVQSCWIENKYRDAVFAIDTEKLKFVNSKIVTEFEIPYENIIFRSEKAVLMYDIYESIYDKRFTLLKKNIKYGEKLEIEGAIGIYRYAKIYDLTDATYMDVVLIESDIDYEVLLCLQYGLEVVTTISRIES